MTIETERKPFVWETYNGQLASMRQQGNTLQAIGNTVGVTRERVRQILAEHYGRIEMLLLPESRAAKVIGCLPCQLLVLRKHGTISPKHTNRFWLYDRDEMEKAMLALQRSCPHCGKLLPLLSLLGRKRAKYCPSCSKESIRYSYPFRSEEGKKKAKQACVRWGKEHPERAGEIARRATKKYLMKKRQEERGYPQSNKEVNNEIS